MNAIGAPTEIGRIPAEEILLPVSQKVGIVSSAPTASDGIALEIDVDAALLGFVQKLAMRRRRGPWLRELSLALPPMECWNLRLLI